MIDAHLTQQAEPPAPQLAPEKPVKQTRLGAYRNGAGWEFLLWAPQAQQVELHLFATGETGVGDRYIPMTHSDGYHRSTIADLSPGTRYLFRLNGEAERPDPASRWQPDGVHGASALLDSNFGWTDEAWRGIELRDYIFYELHVGAYTREGTFDGLIPRLDELRELGVTAVELMPVAEFPGSRNWGYDGVYPFAAHHAYGGAAGLKRLVDACHRAGLAVVLDVVYNHLGPEGNYLAEFGAYFTDRYRTPWGSAVNFDGPQSDHVVRYFIENALQWLDEFHIDALRLDAIHNIFDSNARPFLACLSEAVAKFAATSPRRVHLIAESDLNDARVVRPRNTGGYGLDAQWSDDFHHALHALQTGERNCYYEDFGSVADLAKAFRSGFVYEGQYSRHRQQRHGNSAAAIEAQRFVVCAQNHDQVGNRMLGERSAQLLTFEAQKLSAAAVLWSPYLPLLFMGEEFAETHPFLYFTSHSDEKLAEAVRSGRRAEFESFAWKGEVPDPQSEQTFLASKVCAVESLSEQQKKMRAFYREVIRLRKAIPALRELTKDNLVTEASDDLKFLRVHRWSNEGDVLVLLHFGDEWLQLPNTLPKGEWSLKLDSASADWFGPGSRLPEMFTAEDASSLFMAPHSAVLLSRI